MDNAFLGMNNFVWWIGVVEDNNDPLRIARCRVRIFGWHTSDKNLIPTADLPWSHAVLPINNSLSFNVPQMGDWVTGYFFDGQSGQFPAYFGVLPGVISPDTIKNPDKGFKSPETKGATTATVKQEKDGSGSTIKNDPFVPTPKIIGAPTTNLEAMHLDTAKPKSVTDKMDKKVNDILGPNAASTGDKLTAAATAAAATSPAGTKKESDGKLTEKKKCGPDEKSLLGDIGKLITSGKDLLADTENFINSEIESAAASAASSLGITDGLNTISSAIDSASSAVSGAIDTATTAMNDMKAAAEKELAEQLHNLELTAKKYEKMASDSLKKTIDDLSLESGSLGCYILGSIAPSAASITTKLPVIVDPKTKISKAVVGAVTYPLPVPHDLPAAIPLSQIPSSHEKSLENSISTWKSSVNVTFPILLESLVQIEASYSSNWFSSGGTVDRVALNTMNYYSKIWAKLKTQKNSIAEAYGKPEVLSELETYIKPYDDKIKVAANKIPEI
jgi:hypothetical protein